MTPTTLDALRWAAGASEDLHTAPDVDEAELLGLVAGHNLFSRLHRRLQAERPRWASRTLTIQAWNLFRYARQRTGAHIAALHEITQAYRGAGGTAILPIKGLSLYALTGEDDSLRVSGDIDLYADDLDGLWAAMTGLGYHTDEDERGEDNSHFAVMSRGDIQVELHRTFPVWAYPAGLTDADLQPAHNPGVWVQPFPDLRENNLRHADMAAHAVAGLAPGTESLRVPDSTLAAFLLCTHAFRHYVEGHALPAPIVRLGEVADIRGLFRHPRFDIGKFQSLVDKFGGHDAVAFARYVVRVFLQDELGEWPGPDEFPMQLTRWSGWATLHTPDELLRPLDPKAAFERLEPNIIMPGRETAPSRVIVQGTERLPVQVSADWKAEGVSLHVSISAPLPPGCRYQVLLYYPYQYRGTRPVGFEIPYKYSNVRWLEIGHGERDTTVPWEDGSILKIRWDEHGCTALVPFPWSALPPAFPSGGMVPMMALVMRLREAQPPVVRLREDVLTLLPLQVVRQDPSV